MSLIRPPSSDRVHDRRFEQSAARCALLVALVAAPGCTAIRASVEIQSAMDARAKAVERDTEHLAPYEHTMAERYLEKAWEELGSREYRTTVDLARTSEQWSDLAVAQAARAPATPPDDLEDTAPKTTPVPLPADPVPLPADPGSTPDGSTAPDPAPPPTSDPPTGDVPPPMPAPAAP